MTRASQATAWLLWVSVLTASHLILLASRDPDAHQAHVVLVFLLIVLGGSASGAPWIGPVLALVGFLLIDYSYQPPFGTFTVAKPLDWAVLTGFLATAVVAATLVAEARAAADDARSRADEVTRLSAAARRAAALEEADQMKNALISSVSHDLRTPLTTIRALAADIRDEPAAGAEIVKEVDRLEHMVRNVLDFSRAEAGGAFVPQINTADDLIGAALRQCAARLRSHTVRTTVPDADVLVGYFDFEQALRALTNLVDNAAKYSPAGSPVHVTAHRDPHALVIAVSDRGPGVPAGEEARIFAPFYRPAHMPPDAGSSGLGLAIARRLAEGQGGSVVHEHREGGGSVFTLRLPLAES